MAKNYVLPKGKAEKIQALKQLYINGDPNLSETKLCAEISSKTGVSHTSLRRYISDNNWQRIVNPEAQKAGKPKKQKHNKPAPKKRIPKPKKTSGIELSEATEDVVISVSWNDLSLRDKMQWVQYVAEQFMKTEMFADEICKAAGLPYVLFSSWIFEHTECFNIWQKAMNTWAFMVRNENLALSIRAGRDYAKSASRPIEIANMYFTPTGVDDNGGITGVWITKHKRLTSPPLLNPEILAKWDELIEALSTKLNLIEISQNNDLGQLSIEEAVNEVNQIWSEYNKMKQDATT